MELRIVINLDNEAFQDSQELGITEVLMDMMQSGRLSRAIFMPPGNSAGLRDMNGNGVGYVEIVGNDEPCPACQGETCHMCGSPKN